MIFPFPSGPLSTNAFLFADGNAGVAAVIDPAPGSLRKIMQKAEEQHLRIEYILLTHSHWDHFADAARLQQQTKALLYVHTLDAQNVEEPGSDGLPLPLIIPPAEPDFLFVGGEKIHIGSLEIEVLHTPGHSPGSVCFYCAEHHLLFAGDTLFRCGIGRTDLPTGNPQAMKTSLQKLSSLPAETRVLSGHGPDTTIGALYRT